LHSQKPDPIVHRDLKCDNIFINSHKGDILIGDLGYASILSNHVMGSVLGTPEYMAPEVLEESYDITIDIYSFGMCVLEISTRMSPYYECKGNPYQIYHKLKTGVWPASVARIQNKDLKNFIEQCIGPPEGRPSAAQLLQDRFLQPSENDNLVIEILPEQKKIECTPKELGKEIKSSLQTALEINNQEICAINDDGEKASQLNPKQRISEKKIQASQPDTVAPIRLSKPSEKETTASPFNNEHDGNNKVNLQPKEKTMAKSQFGEHQVGDGSELGLKRVSSNSPPSKNIDIPISQVSLCQVVGDPKKIQNISPTVNKDIQLPQALSHPKPARSLIQTGGGMGSEEQKKKKEKLSIIEDMKLEFHGDELHIINNLNEDIDIPLDSLKVSTIHDISKNIQDKLQLDTLDHEELFLLESKLGSALRFKELAAGNSKDQAKKLVEKDTRDPEQIVNHDTDSLLEDMFDTEEDLLMMQTQAFEAIYKKEYLSKVLSESWRDESIHQMSLRHEAELNELKKMHTQQKQELLDEMRRRKEKVRRIGEKNEAC